MTFADESARRRAEAARGVLGRLRAWPLSGCCSRPGDALDWTREGDGAILECPGCGGVWAVEVGRGRLEAELAWVEGREAKARAEQLAAEETERRRRAGR